jgi:hypothetical protein
MNFFDVPNNVNLQADVTASTNEQNIEVASATQIGQTLASFSVYDYLGGLAIMLIFLAITRMIRQSVYQTKFRRESNVEFLERIWRMDTYNIRD